VFANVALPIPGLEPLTYRFPPETSLRAGARVLVPLGRRTGVGIVTGLLEQAPGTIRDLKTILRVLEPEPVLTEDLLALGKWIAGYYRCSWGEALAAMVPAFTPAPAEEWFARMEGTGAKPPARGMALTLWERLEAGPLTRRELLANLTDGAGQALSGLRRRGLIASERRESQVETLAATEGFSPSAPLALTPDQQRACETIAAALASGPPAAFLLEKRGRAGPRGRANAANARPDFGAFRRPGGGPAFRPDAQGPGR